jgi:hypothetical protein
MTEIGGVIHSRQTMSEKRPKEVELTTPEIQQLFALPRGTLDAAATARIRAYMALSLAERYGRFGPP